ncbi:MAG TPA: tripartite tricarboxylate transporter substrate binding protein [Xanthobacteraceae bacterium]|nr:tripartite tricarboxylate transporter substrate binding protein [Xanthobacteraceae bacterium]
MAAAALPAYARNVWAESYPVRPVHLIVPIAPSLTPDILARLIGQRLSETLGQPFIIENRPGGDQTIGTEIVTRAAPDGYTLLLATAACAVNASLYDHLNYNFIRDIAPAVGLVRVPLVMEVNPSVPAKTLPEFIDYAKANPGKINMASGGNGSPQHVAGELFKMMTGIDMVHIPYRGNMLPDLMAGQVQVYFGPLPSSIGFIQSGKLRALAVTSAARSQSLPDVPAIAEFVPGFEADAWYGLGAPAGTPVPIADKLNIAVNDALADPGIKAKLAELGAQPMPLTPAEFGKFIVDETEKWGKVVKFAGIKPAS